MRKFPERLRELRTDAGLSYMQLGKLIDVSNATICRWEHSQADVKGDEIIKLAKFFGVSADYLLGLED